MAKHKDLPPEERVWPTWKEVKECAKETKRVLAEVNEEHKKRK